MLQLQAIYLCQLDSADLQHFPFCSCLNRLFYSAHELKEQGPTATLARLRSHSVLVVIVMVSLASDLNMRVAMQNLMHEITHTQNWLRDKHISEWHVLSWLGFAEHVGPVHLQVSSSQKSLRERTKRGFRVSIFAKLL